MRRKDRFLNRVIYLEKRRSAKKRLRKLLAGRKKLFGEEEVTLTDAERKAARDMWRPLDPTFDLRWHAFYKQMSGHFDPRYMPEDIWRIGELTLNPPLMREPLQHKVLAYHFLGDMLPTPLGASCNGTLLDNHFQPTTLRELVDRLMEEDEFFCKVANATCSGGGRDVHVICPREMGRERLSEFLSERIPTSKDYIFQKTMRCAPELARYSTSAVNTMRLITLNINGRASYLSTFFRVALADTRVDNVGKGGMMISIAPDGSMYRYGYNEFFADIFKTSATGVPIEGEKIPEFEKIKQTCLDLHARLPYFGFVAWDVTLDEEHNVRLLEFNLDGQDTFEHQMFNGPFFGDRTEEVIKYLAEHPVRRFRTF